MTPPAVEYWRVWSDSAGRYADICSECDSVVNAEDGVSAGLLVAYYNRRNWRGYADWRPVRVRETVVDDRQPLAANSLADVYAENAALTEALKMARMHHEASANIANADRAVLRARVSELEAQLAERTDTLRTFQIAPREPG
ncbi:MAG: hypothetical protein IPK60_21120 [Sandaracinaceae bacterium]|nr:hypothetical protein [Sandaracinaceae bacterium]